MASITGTRGHDHDHKSDGNFGSYNHKPDPAPDPGPPNEAIVWNELMLHAIELSSPVPGPPIATRAMAIESLAVFNAVSAIEGTPGYLLSLTAPEDASTVAAANATASACRNGPRSIVITGALFAAPRQA
jgi:hypothetical protein